MRIRRYLLRLTAVVAVGAVVGAAVAAAPAQAVPAGDFTITMAAADLGLDPSILREVVNDVNTEDVSDGLTLNQSVKRQVAEYGGDTSGWVDVDLTATISSDGSQLTLSVPHAEVQTTAAWWVSLLATTLGVAAGYAFRGGCMTGLALTAIGAALIPLICTPFGGAITGLTQSLIVHFADHDIGSPAFWTDTAIKVTAAAVGGFFWEKWLSPFFKGPLPAALGRFGTWLQTKVPGISSWFGTSAGSTIGTVAEEWIEMGPMLPARVTAFDADPPAAGPLPCDAYDGAGTNCVGTYSTARALYSYYGGPLYQVQRSSDGAKTDIGLLAAGGYVNAAEQDSFCAGTPCVITRLYDQSPEWNDLSVAPGGGAAPNPDAPASATALPITVNGHEAYGVDIEPGMGYRNNRTRGIAVKGQPEGMYMVASGTHANPACCFDFGNGEANSLDNLAAHMDAVNLSTTCWPGGQCTGNGPWVQADLEDGLFMGPNNTNLANNGNSSNFVTALLKNNGQTTFALKGGDAQAGPLSTWYDGLLPKGYTPMKQEGGIILGTGGDNSNWGTGSFFEGAMTAGYPSDAADNAAQAGVVAAHYDGNSAGVNLAASTAGPAVAHGGYASVYTVTSGGHLQETFLPAIGGPWTTQDMFTTFHTPPVMPGTEPVAVTHDGYTSVYTVDAGGGDGPAAGDLQETFLPAIGKPWLTQDLSVLAHTPPTNMTPTAVYHDGYTSVYTVNRADRHLQETFLPALNAGWTTQDLSAVTHGPAVLAGTSPVAVYHDGYTSVYAVNGDDHLQETFLPALGAGWSTQDMKTKFKTPDTTVTPTAVYHSGYTSVYTVDKGDDGATAGDLQETFLPAIGRPWDTQDMSVKFKTPTVAPGTTPVALFHTGYTSVYTVDEATDHLQETFLPAIGQPWTTQDMNTKSGTPPTAETPIVLLHSDATGIPAWTSVFTINENSDDLQETYLTAIGQSWVTQNLSDKFRTPPDADPDSPPAAGPAVAHDGYTSMYTVDTNGDLQETYLTAAAQPWATQDLAAKAGARQVMPGTKPVAVTHDGYTSVYTIDAGNGHLRETWLPALGQAWLTQDLTAKTGTPPANTTPAAVVHDGYTSVYTVDAGNGHLRETWLPALGQSWVTQDLSVKAGTPPVQAGTSPAVVFHSGYTSVYTADASHHLQETYLPALGAAWITQDLSAKSGTPPTSWTPAAVLHNGYTSVYTVDDPSRDLQETYLPAIGDTWSTQDMSTKFGTPPVASGTQPVAIYHTGYTSVYTVGQGNGHLWETFLPAIGNPWATQDLSAKTGGAATAETPVALVHADASGGLTWTSVYTVDQATDHLRETYLQALGGPWVTKDLAAQAGIPSDAVTNSPTAGSSVAHDGYTSEYTVNANGDLQETYLTAAGKPWVTQDLTKLTGGPPVRSSTQPVAVTHDGYTSVYTTDANGDLQETWLPALGQAWVTQDLSATTHTPASKVSPAAVYHSGYTSVYTVDGSNGNLWENYLSALGAGWTAQNLTAKVGTPAVDAFTYPVAAFHDGYTSVYTVDGATADLQETYLPALGGVWATQDLSATAGTPRVNILTSPTAVVHSGYVSVYTVDAVTNDVSKGDLQETYLPAIGDPWHTQDLSAIGGTPQVTAGSPPMALFHSGYTSVYTIDAKTAASALGDVQETYLPAIGGTWSTQNLTAVYHTPDAFGVWSVVLHYDTGGGLTWTSVYTIDTNDDIQETYLPALGAGWTTQDLSKLFQVPAL